MKNNRGVTLTSLALYVVLLGILLVIFTFISANYTSQIAEVVGQGKIANEYIKVYSFLIADVKSANSILEYSKDFVRFDNDVTYTVKYLSNRATERIQYEIYRNNVLIGENIMDAKFDYKDGNLSLYLEYIQGKNTIRKSHEFKVGKEY